MREYAVKIGYDRLNGLRKSDKNLRNGIGLVDCFRSLPEQLGLRSYRPITSLFDDEFFHEMIEPKAFPLPQMFLGVEKMLIVYKGKVYEIDYSVDPWTFSLVLNLPFNNPNPWSLADFQGHMILCSASGMMRYDLYNETWNAFSGANDVIPAVTSCCNFRGQFIGGNVTNTFFDCDSRFVVWSKIGSHDYTIDQMNTAGYMPMPFNGEVVRVIPLDDYVIVYCSNGIAALDPKAQTFGLKVLANVGIQGYLAVNTIDNIHIFIDNYGILRRIRRDIQSGLVVEKLDYQEFFDISDTWSITVNEGDRCYYICNGEKTYVLTEYGLGVGGQIVYGTVNVGDNVYGIVTELEDQEMTIKTDNFDFGLPGQKTVEALEIAAKYDGDCYGSIDYRFSHDEAWRTTSIVRFNKEGIARIPCAGTDFRFNLEFSDYSSVDFDYMLVKY